MRFPTKLIALGLLLGTTVALADLEPWKDYEESQEVWSVTTIRVQPNMDDAYLEGIAKTWVTTNEAAKKLGQIEDYEIFRSDLPQSGEFNLLLIVKFAKTDDLAPNKARYDAFMKSFGKTNVDETTVYSQKNYPAMREITGQYLFRKITLKK
ncbi:MAG TPA: hypothetical protein VKB41_04690 [Steroidobacteraceae bacterium]|nr:hypothetical protein [Steroidobacteraceae bacterium]